MDVSANTWSALSKLLDEALDLEPAARTAWLEQLTSTQPELAPSLRKLLAAHASSETADVMAHLPPLSLRSDAARVGGLTVGDEVGPYRLKRELGAGGMADVWLAERADGAFTREVALKLPMMSRLRRDLAQRFARERDILARLEYPHIARFYDAGITDDGLPYLAMEYVDGQTITEYSDQNRLTIEARLALFMQVLEAVRYAHANLIIHRDLKPSNILVTADGQVRLLDFGIAKLLADDDTAQETQLTQLSGSSLTPDYASPEQIKGEPLTVATDIYSLGVVLYELLAGARPYRLKVKSQGQLEQAIVEAEPSPPSASITSLAAEARQLTDRRMKRAVAGDLDAIVLKALEKAPSHRYLTVSEFALDLTAQSEGRPISARRASARYRAIKFLARNRVAVATASAITVILVGASAISWRQASVAEAEAARAEEVKTFVLEIFNSAGASGGGNRQTTGVELLNRARERLATKTYTDDRIKSELMMAIGASLRGLGDVDAAIPILAEATEFSAKKFGEDHSLTARAYFEYAVPLTIRNRFAEARPYIESAQRTFRRLRDGANLSAALQLASRVEGDVDRAVQLAAEAVEAVERYSPTDKRALRDAYFYFARQLRTSQRQGALEPARRAYELAKEVDGERRTDTLLRTHALYAQALADDGQPAAAMGELKLILEDQLKLFGGLHPHVATALRDVGELARDMGDPRAAIGYAEQLTRLEQTNTNGGLTPGLLVARGLTANALGDLRRYPAAIAELRVTDAMATSLRGAESSYARMVRSAIGRTLTKMGKLEEAEPILTALYNSPSKTPLERAAIDVRFGLLRSAQGRHEEAEALMRPAVAAFDTSRSPIVKMPYQVDLATALIDGGKPAEALALLQEAKSIYSKWQPNGSPDLADVAVEITRANLALGRTSDALESSASAVSYWKSFDPDSESSALAQAWRARAEAQAGTTRQTFPLRRQ
jgi:serine/threonine protein kinase